MNKKELALVEELKTRLALKHTDIILPDVDIPIDGVVNGYSFNSYRPEVYKSCSSPHYHGEGWIKTSSQNPIKQYSSRILALKAMRNEMEYRFASVLREIDLQIEAEI